MSTALADVPSAQVVVCAVKGRARDETLAAVACQLPLFRLVEQDPHDDLAYASDLRKLWREPGDLVIIEQDVIPPPGAIAELLSCQEWWCSHPHWTGRQYDALTLGLVRWSHEVRYLHPQLADRALARMNRAVARVCLRAGDVSPWQSDDPRDWPTTTPHTQCDVRIARELMALGHAPHVHYPPTIHLRRYHPMGDADGKRGVPDPHLTSAFYG